MHATQHSTFFFIDKVKLALKLAHRKARDGIYSANHEEEIIHLIVPARLVKAVSRFYLSLVDDKNTFLKASALHEIRC